MEREHKVEVWGRPEKVTVYQNSKSVWVAIGTYMDKHIEVKGRTATQAIGLWREAARYAGG